MDEIRQFGEYAKELGCEVRYDEPMSRHTTFRIGGPADVYLVAPDSAALRKLCKKSGELGVRVVPLGNGSNTLVRDEGVRGAVIALGEGFRKIEAVGNASIECGAGVSLARLCSFARDCSLTGLEFAWGIPGLVGGAAFMNAGAYGGSMSEVIAACSHVTPSGEAGALRRAELCFGYRHSAYAENGCFITSVRVALQPGRSETISAAMDDLYSRRKEKQPLELPSAGSVFKRPEGHFAGTLIEQCGLKGRRVGGAEVSGKHAGFIVNMGGATCGDVLALIEVIRETVLRETGVALECEVKTLG